MPDINSSRLGREMPDFCRGMVDSSPMPMAFLLGDHHVIQYANPAFIGLFRELTREFIGESFSDAVPESSECLALLDRVYRTGYAETHIGKEGTKEHSFYWSYMMWPVFLSSHERVGTMIQITESTPVHLRTVAVNQALIIGSVRQNELMEKAEALNVQLQAAIIQRERAERETAVSEARLHGLIEAIPQVVWTANSRGEIEFANSKWVDSFGVEKDIFNQFGWAQLLHPDDKDRSLAAWTNGLKSQLAFQVEHRLQNTATGSYHWYFTRAVPIETTDEKSLKWFGTSTDINDYKRDELEMFSKQKLDSIGVLAGGIAHDFNNLLCVIMGGTALIKETLPAAYPGHETLDDIVHATERAAHLTRQMLAYAGKGRLVIELIDVNELVQTTCDLVEASIPKDVRLTIEARPELPAVLADLGQTEQVVMNLVLNAVEAIDNSRGGWIRVKTDQVEMTPALISKRDVVAGTLTPGLYVSIDVSDNGIGMDEATRGHILEPFFTTKFTGRGLGLSAVGGILRGQKGSLEVQSTFGQGSQFRVYLPASPMPVPPRRGVNQHVGKAATKILLVDDEEMVRKIAQRSLEGGGFEVFSADGGIEALRILQSSDGSNISLIVLDLNMPGMSGKQTMESIRNLGIQIPIVICSGYSQDEIARDFSAMDIAGIVQKPFTPQQLLSAAQNALRGPKKGH